MQVSILSYRLLRGKMIYWVIGRQKRIIKALCKRLLLYGENVVIYVLCIWEQMRFIVPLTTLIDN
jgi:hypothetical protein